MPPSISVQPEDLLEPIQAPTEPEKPYDSSLNFHLDAQAILEESNDLDVAMSMLSESYDSARWDNPEDARNTAVKYGTLLRQKFEDTSGYGEEIKELTPYTLNDFKGVGATEDERNISQVNQWEAANTEALKTSSNSDDVVEQDKMIKDVASYASVLRRDSIGNKNNWLVDKFYRATEGAAGSVLKLTGLEDYDRALRERTNKKYDDDFGSEIASGAGMVGAIATLGVVPGLGEAYLGGTALEAVTSRYAKTKEITGDRTRAIEAAGIEGIAQGVMLTPAGKVFGGLGKTLRKSLGKEVLAPVVGGIGKKVLTSSIYAGGGMSIGGGISEAGSEFGGEKTDHAHSYATRRARQFAVGAIFGGAAEGFNSYLKGGEETPPPPKRPPPGDNPLNAPPGGGPSGGEGVAAEPPPQPPPGGGADFVVGEAGNARATTPEEKLAGLQAKSRFENGQDTETAPLDGITPDTIQTVREEQFNPDISPDEAIQSVAEGGGSFKTRSASGKEITYTLTPDGKATIKTRADGTVTEPWDRTFYISKVIAEKLDFFSNKKNRDGSETRIITDGEKLFIQSSWLTEDLKTKREPGDNMLIEVPMSETPGTGLYPVDVAKIKTDAKVTTATEEPVSAPRSLRDRSEFNIPDSRVDLLARKGEAPATNDELIGAFRDVSENFKKLAAEAVDNNGEPEYIAEITRQADNADILANYIDEIVRDYVAEGRRSGTDIMEFRDFDLEAIKAKDIKQLVLNDKAVRLLAEEHIATLDVFYNIVEPKLRQLQGDSEFLTASQPDPTDLDNPLLEPWNEESKALSKEWDKWTKVRQNVVKKIKELGDVKNTIENGIDRLEHKDFVEGTLSLADERELNALLNALDIISPAFYTGDAQAQSPRKTTRIFDFTDPLPKVERAPKQGPVTGFTTAKGSTYTVEGQTTTRNKAARPEHPGDSGPKKPSDVTYYVSKRDAQEVGGLTELIDVRKKRIVVTADGDILITHFNEKAGKQGKNQHVIKNAKTTPEKGLYPLELWDPDENGWFRGWHPGNEITAVERGPVREEPGQANTKIYRPPFIGHEITDLKTAPAPTEGPFTGLASKLGGDDSVGAAKIIKTAETLQEDPNLDRLIRDALNPDNPNIWQIPYKIEEVKNSAQAFLADKGPLAAFLEIMSLPDDQVGEFPIILGEELLNYFSDATGKARKAGLKDQAEALSELGTRVAEKVINMGSKAGKALRAVAVLSRMSPRMIADSIRSRIKKAARDKIAKKLGIDPEELFHLKYKIKGLEEQIAPFIGKEDTLSPADLAAHRDLLAEQVKLIKWRDMLETYQQEQLAEWAKVEERYKAILEAAKTLKGGNRELALQEALKLEEPFLGRPGEGDLFYSYFLANILSNPATQAVNVVGNIESALGNLAAFTITGAARGTFDAPSFIRGFINGARHEGVDAFFLELQGIKTYRPDIVSKQNSKDTVSTRGLELERDFVRDGPYILNNLGYVFRALKATDAFFYKALSGAHDSLIAYNAARNSGKRGVELQKEIDRLIGGRDHRAAALVQARKESLILESIGIKQSKRQIRQRAAEIVGEGRPEFIRQSGDRFSQKALYTETPDGVVGLMVAGLQKFANYPIPILGKDIRPFRYLIPFLNVAGNMANGALDYTIIGYAGSELRHAALPKSEQGAFNIKNSKNIAKTLERHNQLGKFIIGSTLAGMAHAIAMSFLNDKNPRVAIYGAGPKDPDRRKEWEAQGGRPYSVKYGDTHVKYAETPFVFLLGALGNLHDRLRWDKSFSTKDTAGVISAIIAGSGKAFLDNGFLKNTADLVESITNPDSGKKITDILFVNVPRGFIPGLGALNFASKIIEDPIETRDNLYAKWLSGIPFVQGIGTRPALAYFGEPVERTFEDKVQVLGRFYSHRVTDPDWRWIGDNDYNLPDIRGWTIKLEKGHRKEKFRAEELGPQFSNVLTLDERYELIQRSGPEMKAFVGKLRQRYGNGGKTDRIQKQLEEGIGAIQAKWKQKLFLR